MRAGVAGSFLFPFDSMCGGAGKMCRDRSRQEAVAGNDQEGGHKKKSSELF